MKTLLSKFNEYKQHKIYTRRYLEWKRSIHSLHWSSRLNQERRFENFVSMAALNNHTLLDVGCGFGDLYNFLNKNNISTAYTGLDINKYFIEEAQELYPQASFIHGNLFQNITTSYDYIVASGLFAFANKSFFTRAIEHFYKFSDKGFIFNIFVTHDKKFFSPKYEVINQYLNRFPVKQITTHFDASLCDYTYLITK